MKSALFVKTEQNEDKLRSRTHTFLFDSFTDWILFTLEILNYKLQKKKKVLYFIAEM